MGLIRYSCGHISGHHEPIHVKFGVWGFFFYHVLLKYCHENAEMQKKKIWWRHTSVLYGLKWDGGGCDDNAVMHADSNANKMRI